MVTPLRAAPPVGAIGASPNISFFPGVALLVIIVAIDLAPDWLRDVFNPRLAGHYGN